MPTNWTKFIGVGRFILGILILVGIFWLVPTLAHASPLTVVMMLVAVTPLTFLIWPITIVGLYFLFTPKIIWRVDVIALVVVAIAFYGTYQFINPATSGDIRGNAVLNVTVLTELQKPVTNLEVDLAEKSGPPPQGGSVKTDDKGVAAFSVKPGDYVIYFSSGNFPQNLVYPNNSQPVHVAEGKTNEATVILKTK